MADTNPEAQPAPSPEAPAKFRVLHGAVSGVSKNKKGERIEHDYHADQIVTADQLDGNADVYLIQGAVTFAE